MEGWRMIRERNWTGRTGTGTAAMHLALGALLALAPAPVASGQEEDEEIAEIVVTATRTATPSEEVASSVTVITSGEIQRKQQATVLEVLRDVPALDVSQSGGTGRQTSVFIRGTKSSHTLVLIDGIELNNPIGIGRGVELAHMTVDNIERIEIVRGPQSTLYGSDALGGVINIITKKGKGEPSYSFFIDGGSYKTLREIVTASGSTERLNYSVSASRLDTEGFSAASEAYGNTEKDGYGNTSFCGTLGLTSSSDFKADFLLRFTDAKSEIDDGGGPGADDPDRVNNFRQFVVGAKTHFRLMDGRWKQSVGLSLVDHHREDIDPGEFESTFDGRLVKLDWQNNFALNETSKLVFGAELESEKGSSTWQAESDAQLAGLYVQDQMKFADSFFATVGARVDIHSTFDTHATYRATGAYAFGESGTKVSATLGTGFKAPSLYQLYSSSGNLGLKPEESTAWDLGVEQRLLENKVSLSITYFKNDFENLIAWAWTGPGPWDGEYQNIERAESKGVEFEASFKPTGDLTIGTSYTYTDATEAGAEALKRPKNKAGLSVNYRFLDKGNVNFGVIYVGDRKDFGGVTLEAYALVNLAVSYDLTEKVKLIGRIENLLNREYEEVYGYGAPGLSAYVGVKATF